MWGPAPPKPESGRRTSTEKKKLPAVRGNIKPNMKGKLIIPAVKGGSLDHMFGMKRRPGLDSFYPNPKDKRPLWDEGWAVDEARYNENAPQGQRLYFEKGKDYSCPDRTAERISNDDPKLWKKATKMLRVASAPVPFSDYAAFDGTGGPATDAAQTTLQSDALGAETFALNSIDEDEINPGSAVDLSVKPSPKGASPASSKARPSPKPRAARATALGASPEPPQIPRHKGLIVRPQPKVRWFSIVDEDTNIQRPDWDDRWWMAHSRQNHIEPLGKRDYFDRPRRSPAADPAWPEASDARRVIANWRNEEPNWGERERARLTKIPSLPEREFVVPDNALHNDGKCGGQRLFFSNELPLYLDPQMLHRPQKTQFDLHMTRAQT